LQREVVLSGRRAVDVVAVAVAGAAQIAELPCDVGKFLRNVVLESPS
jgi:hypothetical protein